MKISHINLFIKKNLKRKCIIARHLSIKIYLNIKTINCVLQTAKKDFLVFYFHVEGGKTK